VANEKKSTPKSRKDHRRKNSNFSAKRRQAKSRFDPAGKTERKKGEAKKCLQLWRPARAEWTTRDKKSINALISKGERLKREGKKKHDIESTVENKREVPGRRKNFIEKRVGYYLN